MFKKISWIVVALIAALSMVFMGCPDDEKYGATDFVFTLEGKDIVLESWGNNAPTITDNQVAIEASGSTGFTIDFGKLVKGYVYNKNAKVVFTYEIVDLKTPEAVLTVKNSEGWADTAGDSDYGIGNGREFFLGSELTGDKLKDKETASNYVGAITEGTYDKETKVGTFEVYLRHLMGLKKIGFQHNVWAEFGKDNKVAEDSEYTVKFTKIQSFLVKAVNLPPEPDAYILKNYSASFDWTTTDVTGTVINVGPATSVANTKPSWDIDESTTPKASAFSGVGTGAAIVIKFGDISESKVGYWQIAIQWYDGSGGNGWEQLSQLDGNGIGEFPNIKSGSDWTWDADNNVLTVPLTAAAIKFVNGTADIGNDDDPQTGFCIRFNASGEANLDIIAVGITEGD